MTPIATATASSSDLADRIHRKLDKKFRGHHGITIESDNHEKSNDDIPAMVIPLVGIVFMTIFGAPVLIVMTIGLITLMVTRMRQRTIRVMVEKGQPVPAELLAPATRAVRQRSDVRRVVIWVDPISDRRRVSDGVEVGRKKQRSSSAARTVESEVWS